MFINSFLAYFTNDTVQTLDTTYKTLVLVNTTSAFFARNQQFNRLLCLVCETEPGATDPQPVAHKIYLPALPAAFEYAAHARTNSLWLYVRALCPYSCP